ncbi:PhzF family phenazine biosynthesis protein [Alkalihalobacterium bogoriense]|uniref:PhzF family phenazine biosynthesis protein n=1 Tax=Alkalihalobacterium bogoriense TaxID=246272 RepID=UPI0004795A58|nr:PhzF family phenazine biosynthesis protein [Alkalihalobacterium bogoriense]
MKVFHVDAFTEEKFSGNPAGVVPEATTLTKNQMQQIAREVHLSETAFLMPTTNGNADFRILYFTPQTEIDFCGHATLAAAWIVATETEWQKESVRFETNIGIVPVEFTFEDQKLLQAYMTQAKPKTKDLKIDIDELASILGLQKTDFDQTIPIKLASTGNWHLLVPVKTRKAIENAVPNFSLLRKHNENKNIITTHLFTFDCDIEGCLLYTRDFAPAVGIDEDPFTGSANGALAGYLALEAFEQVNRNSYIIAQGHKVGRPGYCHVTIENNGNQPTVKIGGAAVKTISGFVHL